MAAKKPRKKRSDSAETQTRIMRDVLTGKEPPHYVKINEGQRPFWDAIIAARADWTEVDLVHAAALARVQCDIEKESSTLAEEGCIITTKAGNVLNPRVKALQALSTLSINYSVKIQVHAVATTGKAEDNINKNQMKKAAIEAAQNNLSDMEDGLIARPKH